MFILNHKLLIFNVCKHFLFKVNIQEVFSLIFHTFNFVIKFEPYNLQASYFNRYLI